MFKNLLPFLCWSEWDWVGHTNWVKQAMPITHVIECSTSCLFDHIDWASCMSIHVTWRKLHSCRIELCPTKQANHHFYQCCTKQTNRETWDTAKLTKLVQLRDNGTKWMEPCEYINKMKSLKSYLIVQQTCGLSLM